MTASTPRQSGYYMPAEWAPQEAIWLAWPHNQETWPESLIEEVQTSYLEIIRLLSPHQRIRMLVNSAEVERTVRNRLASERIDVASIDFFAIPSQDVWIRDYGPTFIVNPDSAERAMVKWNFNAWGGKYVDLIADDRVAFRIHEHLGLPMFEAGIVLEGGSIEVNGAGVLLTTEQCLLNPNRNPRLGRQDLEPILQEFLGVSCVLWLGEGISGDDTDGHIDDIARFVDRRTVVCGFEEDPLDENYKVLEDNFKRLSGFRDRNGTGLNVVKLPMPGYVEGDSGRLPASYANFYIGNKTVVVPVFGHPNDTKALEILRGCFPRRHVVGVNCRAMLGGLGAIHCCSQQEPQSPFL